MMSIELKDVMIFGGHGVYEGESATGNLYHIDLSVRYNESNTSINTLQDTINYVELYEIVRQRMLSPTDLLEEICQDIVQQISVRYPFVAEVLLSIYKIQAPIENFQGKVGVTLHKVLNV